MIYAIFVIFEYMSQAEKHEIASLACSYDSVGTVVERDYSSSYHIIYYSDGSRLEIPNNGLGAVVIKNDRGDVLYRQ